MYKLKLSAKGHEEKSFSLEKGTSLVVGRSESSNIVLVSTKVSKKHCLIECSDNGDVSVEDLNSSNGVFVNKEKITKKKIRSGDYIIIGEYVIQLIPSVAKQVISDKVAASKKNIFQPFSNFEQISSDMISENEGDEKKLDVSDQAQSFFNNNIFPIADRLSSVFDVKFLFLSFFLGWSVLLSVFVVFPIMQYSNNRVKESAVEVAKLYARQLVRVNQRAVIEQKYRDLIVQLDSRFGQTNGVIETLILDAENNQILAPTNLLGSQVTNTFAIEALQSDRERVSIDDRSNTAYVSAPIKISISGTNKTAAVAFVVFDTGTLQFSFLNVFDKAVGSLFFALLISIVLLIFIFRWFDGGVQRASNAIDKAMLDGDLNVHVSTNWPTLNALCEQITFALSRGSLSRGDSQQQQGNQASLAMIAKMMDSLLSPVCILDEGFTCQYLNYSMAEVLGADVSSSKGKNLADLSRDMLFEQSVEQLKIQAEDSPEIPVSTSLNLQNSEYTMQLVLMGNLYILSLDRQIGEEAA